MFALDLTRCALLRGHNELRLRPKAFDVLRYLAEHAGRLVSKEELTQAVWPNTFVTDDAVVQCVRDIRRTLEDDAHQIIKTVPRRGYLFHAGVSGKSLDQAPLGSRYQEIRFCQTRDGVNLAVACAGAGPPLVSIPTWLTHLERDWESPIRAPLWHFLADRYRLIRYDERGFGLSDRNVTEISFAAFEHDLETVVSTLGLRSYTLLGISGGAAVAIAHAARHPECVSKLVLHAGFARGRSKRGPQESEMAKALVAIMREGWGDENSAFLRILSSVWFPGATSDEIKWYADLLRLSTSVENAVRHHEASNNADVVDLLKQISAPTLVLHCRHDNAAPFDGGRRLAAAIPNARFVSLDSENHMPLPREPAWQRFIDEIEAFLSD